MTFDVLVLGVGLAIVGYGWITRQRGAKFLGGAFAALAGALVGHDWLQIAHKPGDVILGAIMLGVFGYAALLLVIAMFAPDQ